MIVAFVGKSSGKTTNAINTATCLAQRPRPRSGGRRRGDDKTGSQVLYLNGDPQGTALHAAAQRKIAPLYTIRDYPRPTIHDDLDGLAAGYDHVVIDCPAGTGKRTEHVRDDRIRVTRSAILAALSHDHGVVVVPITPSPMDLWATDDVMDVIEAARVHAGAAPGAYSRAVILLNQAAPGAASDDPKRQPKIVRAARTYLAGAPLPVLSTVIHRRVDYTYAPTAGLGITEYAPHSPAAAEARALTTELLIVAGEERTPRKR